MKAAAPIVLPNVSERRHVHIINPNAGSKKYYSAAVSAIEKSGEERLESTSGEHLRSLVSELFRRDPTPPGSDWIMIGDRVYDIAGAARHGIPSVGVTWGFGSRDEFAGASYIAESPASLAQYLLRRACS